MKPHYQRAWSGHPNDPSGPDCDAVRFRTAAEAEREEKEREKQELEEKKWGENDN